MKSIISINSHLTCNTMGNSVSLIPMQNIGFHVLPVHTVQLQPRTYFQNGHVKSLDENSLLPLNHKFDTICNNSDIRGVVSGYLGNTEQRLDVAYMLEWQSGVYICNPIIDDDDEATLDEWYTLICLADVVIISENDLEKLTGITIDNIETCKQALNIVKSRCNADSNDEPIIVVENIKRSDTEFSMLLSTSTKICMSSFDINYERNELTGLTDLVTSLFSANYIDFYYDAERAFTYTMNSICDILKETKNPDAQYLQMPTTNNVFLDPTSTNTIEQLEISE